MINEHLKRLFKIRKNNKAQWELIITEVRNTEENPDKNAGTALFINLLQMLPLYAWKRIAYVKRHFKRYRDKVKLTPPPA